MVKLTKPLPNHNLENLESILGFVQTTVVGVLAELGDVRRSLIRIKLMPLLVLIQDVINTNKGILV